MASSQTATLEQAATAQAEGLWAPALTPLDENLNPDAGRFYSHLKRLLDSGCHGATVFGTTGEATSFSIEERESLLEAVVATGIPADRLMVGTGCAALTDTVRLTQHALGLGCKRILMLPPFYYKGISDDGLYACYDETVQRIGDWSLQVYFYHFPKLSAVPITHKVIERLLARYPLTFKGLKDSSGDAESCAGYIKAFPDLAVFPGTETLMLDMLELGAAGCITATANINAPAIRGVWDAFKAGDKQKQERQDGITALRQAIQVNPMIPVLKQVMAKARNNPAWRSVRPPLTTLSDLQVANLEAALDDNGFEFAMT